MTALRGDGRGLPRRIRLILFAAAAALLLILFRQALGQLLWQIALAVLLAYAARPICATRQIDSSTSFAATSIKSASSSMTTTTLGSFLSVSSVSATLL